jgi:FlaA1/EpsC-like NDP-sugar epimerase
MSNFLDNISKKYASKWLILFIDVAIVLFTLFLAYFIRYNFKLDFDFEMLLKQLPLVAVAAIVSFIAVGSHNGVVRYTGFKDVVNIIIGVNILATILLIVAFFGRKFDFDRAFALSGSVIYIHLLLNFLFLIGFKLFIKSTYRKIVAEDLEFSGRALIYGAGDSGMITYEALTTDVKSNLKVVGFIDDNPKKVSKKINLIQVYSFDQINADFIKKNKVDQVIISIQNIDPVHLLNISTELFSYNLKVKIVPPIHSWIDGDLSIGQIKDVNIEDLLGRDPISVINPVMKDEYENETILVTGAAGSIGSEIARKLAQFNYKHLILLDSAESPLYNLQQEFIQAGYTNFTAVVADVRDIDRINNIFDKYKPKIVFHAAAYKHVPLMENNPYEALRVNIYGTKNIALHSVKHGIKKFMLISTDKAVNPTNVMGATKRIAELYVSCLKGKGQTKFITTRFGNVLGSNGSVIPLFKNQIEAGGPLTVTHEEITRYFMTIPEACQLVLEAAVMGNGGEIFAFDMGKSVKIYDLAKNMIFLSGFRYPEDIDIKITGLRPGEKIHEELLADGENTVATYHDKIMIAKTKPFNLEDIELKINDLCVLNSNTQNLEIVSLIKEIVPEFISNNSKFEVLDATKP